MLIAIEDRTEYEKIFGLWEIRMRSLILARLGRIARAEAKVLGDVSSAKYRLEDGTSIVPWDLRLFLVPIWAGGDTQNGLTRYYALAREARLEQYKAAVREKEGNDGLNRGSIYEAKKVWENRLRELGLYMASTLIGMKDSVTAINHLKGLYETCKKVGGEDNLIFGNRAAVSLAFVYLMVGDTLSAREWFQLSPAEYSKELALAVCSLADGDMSESASLLEKHLSAEDDRSIESTTEALNNLAISSLHEGNLNKAIDLLEQIVSNATINPTTLFNLFILYDLQHESPSSKKQLIAEKIKSRGIQSLGTYELFLHR